MKCGRETLANGKGIVRYFAVVELNVKVFVCFCMLFLSPFFVRNLWLNGISSDLIACAEHGVHTLWTMKWYILTDFIVWVSQIIHDFCFQLVAFLQLHNCNTAICLEHLPSKFYSISSSCWNGHLDTRCWTIGLVGNLPATIFCPYSFIHWLRARERERMFVRSLACSCAFIIRVFRFNLRNIWFMPGWLGVRRESAPRRLDRGN